MKDKIELYKKNMNIVRHESGARWYAPKRLGPSSNWKPSVTTVIGDTISKGKGFHMWLGNHPSYNIACEERDKAANRGTEVHNLAEQYMLGETVTSDNTEICKHLMSFEKFWLDNEVQLIETELFMWHKDVPWAGTCDIIAKIGGKYCIIDIKTGNYYKSHEIQLNMYAELLSKIVEEPVDILAGLYTKGKWKREPNYQFKKFKFNLDVALSVHNVWEFLMGGKPSPKAKLNIKSKFQIGGSKDDYEVL
tara:strand:- start:172 stop:918 length:747 start_codon:yes stop_codon:yes gene_type:complete